MLTSSVSRSRFVRPAALVTAALYLMGCRCDRVEIKGKVEGDPDSSLALSGYLIKVRVSDTRLPNDYCDLKEVERGILDEATFQIPITLVYKLQELHGLGPENRREVFFTVKCPIFVHPEIINIDDHSNF